MFGFPTTHGIRRLFSDSVLKVQQKEEVMVSSWE